MPVRKVVTVQAPPKRFDWEPGLQAVLDSDEYRDWRLVQIIPVTGTGSLVSLLVVLERD